MLRIVESPKETISQMAAYHVNKGLFNRGTQSFAKSPPARFRLPCNAGAWKYLHSANESRARARQESLPYMP